MDLSPSFIAGAAEAFPSAEITFDRFHVVKLLNEALNNHPLEAGGLERLATESRDTGQIALLFPLTILRFEIIIRTRFKMMLKIILYHFFGHLPYCDTKITSCPKMLAPISLF